MNDQHIGEIELAGLLWQRGTDNVHFSGRLNGEIVYFASPVLEQRIQAEALKRGISVGDMCDVINLQMSKAEREQMRNSPFGYFEMEVTLTGEQAEQMRKVFFGDDGEGT